MALAPKVRIKHAMSADRRRFQRLREKVDGGKFHVHIADAFGDGRTLCGYAYEGSCTGSGDFGVTKIDRGLVDCQTCLTIIRYCRRIPQRMILAEGASAE